MIGENRNRRHLLPQPDSDLRRRHLGRVQTSQGKGVVVVQTAKRFRIIIDIKHDQIIFRHGPLEKLKIPIALRHGAVHQQNSRLVIHRQGRTKTFDLGQRSQSWDGPQKPVGMMDPHLSVLCRLQRDHTMQEHRWRRLTRVPGAQNRLGREYVATGLGQGVRKLWPHRIRRGEDLSASG